MGVERVMGFCIFLLGGSQIDERSSREFERREMGGVGPGLEQGGSSLIYEMIPRQRHTLPFVTTMCYTVCELCGKS